MAERCEALRADLRERWSADPITEEWRPKCVIVVHSSQVAYNEAIGSAGDSSVGCTTITSDHGEILFRRIDFRTNAEDWQVNALPHELTHVVLADIAGGEPLPRWLNEGLAMTSESEELQRDRLTLLRAAASRDRLPPLQDVLSPSYRPATRAETDLHYAASLSLVSHLRRQGEAEDLLQFAKLARSKGYTDALQRVYEIEGGVATWESLWRISLHQTTHQELTSAAE